MQVLLRLLPHRRLQNHRRIDRRLELIPRNFTRKSGIHTFNALSYVKQRISAVRKLTSAAKEHYLSNVAVDIPEIDGPEANGLLRTRFFPFVMTDPAPFHAVMLIAASHYGKVRGSQSHGIDLLQLRGMAIREINGALEDQARGTSDQLIAAVAQMASYEALFGDEDIYNTHMTGLLRMVSLRGGLPALGLDGLLERMVLWIDINAAHITGSHIYFDRTAFPSTVRHPKPDPRRFTGGITRQGSD